MIAIDQENNKHLMLIQMQHKKINYKRNLAQDTNANTTMILIIEGEKETILGFLQGIVRVL